MPIVVECPSCGAKLNAPDSGAGKKVRCPKAECGTLVPVPEPLEAEEVAVVDAVPAPPPPKPVRAAVADDDEDDRPRNRRRDDDDDDDRPRSRRRRDDDDDDDDRPRRRRGAARRGRSGANKGKVVAFVVGGLLLLGGVGAGVYFLGFGKSSPPSGWKEYTYADAGFKAYFPVEPVQRSGEDRGLLGEVGLAYSFNAYATENGSAMTATVEVRRLSPNVSPDKARERIQKEFEDPGSFRVTGLRVIDSRTVTWMGHKVKEFRLGLPENARRGKDALMVQRIVVTDTHQFIAVIAMEDGGNLSSRLINGFFDNIQPLK